MEIIIGVDDHDSTKAGCTTHFSVLLMRELAKRGFEIKEIPKLVRLNPNLPWKTRGNASVSFSIEVTEDTDIILKIKEIIENLSYKYVTEISKGFEMNRKPGYALAKTNDLIGVKDDIERFYEMALSDVVTTDLAKRFAKNRNIVVGGDRGIIGSIASMGFHGDYSFELLTYRIKDNWDKERILDKNSVIGADIKLFPKVSSNYDYFKDVPLILSHGTDPVLYGLRGTTPYVLLEEMNLVKAYEAIDFFMLFKTNQMTDAHIRRTGINFYQTTKIEFKVSSIKVLEGGHVIINGYDSPVVVYKETRELNSMSKILKNGDVIEVIGSVKPSYNNTKIVEAERIRVISLNDMREEVPTCPKCGKKMESIGKNKGYKCRRCKTFSKEKDNIKIKRDLSLEVYQSSLYRHLTKPIFLELQHIDLRVEKDVMDKILSEILEKDISIKLG
ncbi:tRNA(Ile)(2)-agmatinylcytidine synthase [Sulfuracidifex tepidarius]|uniref:tRNA(Ile2) 2-agmatinylcytidine synthetase TiaS n=1 Tax=Sulfuracidifex tepidarius TaxID=1294262 RepID=A0A510E3Y9_9CREN|nr:tRNA(Ile)(2)-agmatinylcytidine synthase [Sulfuracidifex tepidarius]BBG24473.1 tRNA(Ile2) 2-agmatinylcytidine synthetase TiaS [Sulfuracidifex tepidarius]BBG27231.1 tRNA(Ile2) 2-agmatinylcytidine synthetase TiaS [Sulfuracidifex tepidarius]